MTRAERRGDWMQTFTGRAVWPLDMRAEDIDERDIAHALACQNRFAGHTYRPYSVAEHSIRCMDWVSDRETSRFHPTSERQALLATLLHDATEAYLVDLPRPVKRLMPEYAEAEKRCARVIEEWAGLPMHAFDWPIVKRADEVLLATEKRDLMAPAPMPWHPLPEPIREGIVPWSWEVAERRFLSTLRALLRA